MNNEASLFCNPIHQNSNPKFPPTKELLFIQPKPFVKLQEEEILRLCVIFIEINSC